MSQPTHLGSSYILCSKSLWRPKSNPLLSDSKLSWSAPPTVPAPIPEPLNNHCLHFWFVLHHMACYVYGVILSSSGSLLGHRNFNSLYPPQGYSSALCHSNSYWLLLLSADLQTRKPADKRGVILYLTSSLYMVLWVHLVWQWEKVNGPAHLNAAF